MTGHVTGRTRLLYLLLIVALTAVPTLALAQEGATEAQLLPDAYTRDHEVVLINRTDGRIVIRDFAVGPNMRDLSGKYDQWGGPYYNVATGDFNGDGTREIIATGGAGVTVPGPVLNVWDPVAANPASLVPNHTSVLPSPYYWALVAAADVDGDGRDEIVAVHTTDEPGNIKARVVCLELEGSTWREKWNLATGGSFRDMILADFNGNGMADIIFARDYRYVLVLDGLNPNIEHFNAQVGGPTGVGEWDRIRMGDVTGDGVRDLVLMRRLQAVEGNFPAAVLIITPTTLSTYTDGFGWGFGDPPEDIQLVDFDSDGRLEIAAMNTGELARIYVLNPRMNDTVNNNTMAELWIGDREWGPNLAVGDVNGDGRYNFSLVHTTESDYLPDYFLRVLGFHEAGGYADDTTYFPYSYNFVTANLDGTGVSANPTMSVPSAVTLYYQTSSATGTSQTITVANLTTGSFTWTANKTTAAAWLKLEPASGPSGTVLTFSVDPAAPPVSSTQAVVHILASSPGIPVINGDQYLTVRVEVVDELHTQYLPLAFKTGQ